MTYLALAGAAFLAGLLNATVGGGGLVLIPAVLILLPSHSLPEVLGTVKLASTPGLAVSVILCLRRMRADWLLVASAAVPAVPMSIFGAVCATALDPRYVRPAILVLLVPMTLHTWTMSDFGSPTNTIQARAQLPRAAVIGSAIGFYEGFFGPGSGTLLVYLFVTVVKLELIAATLSALIVTGSAAGAALITFAANGAVVVSLGAWLMGFTVVGGAIGAHLVARRDVRRLRWLLRVALIVLVGHLVYQVIRA